MLGALALIGYAWLALAFPATGAARDVWTMVVVLWLLFLPMLAAWWWLRRGRAGRDGVVVILVLAALFRFVMLFAGLGPDMRWQDVTDDLRGRAVTYDTFLLYDNDVWRYLWDGHVAAHGVDPYRWTPAAIEAAYDEDEAWAVAMLDEGAWWDVYDNVSFRSYHSVYPPLAQHLFRGLHVVAPGSVLALKLALALADFAACLLLVRLLRRTGRPTADAVLYAWNPIVIKELSGSAHLDAVVVLLVVATLVWLIEGRGRRALVAFAGAVTMKLTPLALGGLVAVRTSPRRWWWGIVAGLVVAAPRADGLGAWLAGLGAFARDWTFFPGAWALVRWLLASVGIDDATGAASTVCRLALVAVVLAATLVVATDRRRDPRVLLRSAFVVLAAIPLLNAAVMPWYLTWALPAAVVLGCWSWQVMLAASLLSYGFYVDQVEPTWILLLGHGTFVAVALGEWLAARGRRGARHGGRPPIAG